MEKKKLTINKTDREFYIELNSLFLWKLESENNLKNEKIVLNFVREDSDPNLAKLRVVEMDFQPKILSLFVTIIPTICAFILMTIALIVFFASNRSIQPLLLVGCFFVPDIILLGFSVYLTYLRSKQFEAFSVNKSEYLNKARARVNQVLNK